MDIPVVYVNFGVFQVCHDKFDSIPFPRTDISITTWTGGLLQSGTWSPGTKQDRDWKGLGLGVLFHYGVCDACFPKKQKKQHHC